MTALTVTESSGDGRVSVTVESSGVPTAINLSAGSRGMDPAVLSDEIMSCLRRAHSVLRTEVTELVQNTVGDDEAGVAIIDQYAQRFPDPEPQAAAPIERPALPPSGDVPPSGVRPYFPAQPGAASTLSRSTEPPRSRKPNREQIVVPDEPDPETEYYNRSWLV
ncbi:YbaB/EbfC family nucleoid-associated protein [Nocardia sp. NBC_00508]|uniref:YbaB/EbfC family nucleoid-associated protein n=1 Tax=Nocardia sp. NBC_00508 TaxID=2975992 RepID=UPI002E820375|nr:YbaB/EbfC family nucleoid-associated protein [Nocardia sp. NBC_00508]WUD67716.1 YbaB/EbfC family nucleoid-associated protein [Nocardia sp. NBC_00508]